MGNAKEREKERGEGEGERERAHALVNGLWPSLRAARGFVGGYTIEVHGGFRVY